MSSSLNLLTKVSKPFWARFPYSPLQMYIHFVTQTLLVFGTGFKYQRYQPLEISNLEMFSSAPTPLPIPPNLTDPPWKFLQWHFPFGKCEPICQGLLGECSSSQTVAYKVLTKRIKSQCISLFATSACKSTNVDNYMCSWDFCGELIQLTFIKESWSPIRETGRFTMYLGDFQIIWESWHIYVVLIKVMNV